MSRRIIGLGLVAVAAAVAVVLAVTLWPTGNSAQGASGAHAALTPAPGPARSAPMGKLAYSRNGDVYLANWDGSNAVRIANGSQPIWSPDGRYLGFGGGLGRGASHHEATIISDAQGRLLGSFPQPSWESWGIEWSPDSTRLAMWVRWEHTIGIYNVHGVREKLLRLPPGLKLGGSFEPVWSPDGASVVLPLGPGRILEIPVDGSAPRKLSASDPRSQWGWRYSPDGSQVAYADEPSSQLVVAAADGSGARVLVPSPVDNPVWSPTGAQIAFDTQTPIGLTQIMGRPGEIGVVDVASGKLTTLIAVGGGTVYGGDPQRVIGFSRDGRLLLFTRTNAKNVASLWAVRLGGSAPMRLVSGSDGGQWQPMR
jgi:Tol biopolymer transport system component